MNAAVFEETVRRHVTSLGYISYVIFMALVAVLASTFNTPASLWPPLVTLLSMITGSAIIGPEFSTGTLQLIVSKPVRRWVYVISRVAGVFTSVAIAAILSAGSEMAVRVLRGQTEALPRIATVLGCSLVVAFLAISLLTFLGSITRAYFNAAIYVGGQVTLSILQIVAGMMRLKYADLIDRFAVEKNLIGVEDALFPSVPLQVSTFWVLRAAAIAAVAIVIACLAFERREVPYGAD